LGLNSQVQVAIERNKKVFQHRMRLEDLSIKRRAFNGWMASHIDTDAKRKVRHTS
jgi:hypothetical protein